MDKLEAKALSKEVFAPFGDVIEKTNKDADFLINQGRCKRFHDCAKVDFVDGRAGISLFDSAGASAPFHIEMVERHPLGSQAFIPLNGVPYLVIVADDKDGNPTNLQAFIANGQQIINLYRNVWHGVLTPLERPGLYAVIDRIGEGNNLNEHWFERPYVINSL